MKYNLGVGGIILVSLPAFLNKGQPIIVRSLDTIVMLDSKNVHLKKHMLHERYRVMAGYINDELFESEEWDSDKVAYDDKKIIEKELRKKRS